MRFEVKTNANEFKARISRMSSQVNFALARALTWTAGDARDALRTEMTRVFDRPTSYTLNGVRVWPATKAKLVADVGFREIYTQHYLRPQVEGGSRRLKGLEVRLQKIGVMFPNEMAVPGKGARVDAYGNVSRGQIVQILSQLGSAKFDGDYSTATNSRRSRAKRAKEAYFASRPGREFGRRRKDGGDNDKSQHLPAGIWMRRSFGPWGSAVKPIFLFVRKQPYYQKRFPFHEVARHTARKTFPQNYRRSMAQALKSTR